MSAKGKKSPKATPPAEHKWAVGVQGDGHEPGWHQTITAATVGTEGPLTTLRDARGDLVFASPLIRYLQRVPEPLTLELPDGCSTMSPYAIRSLTDALHAVPGLEELRVLPHPSVRARMAEDFPGIAGVPTEAPAPPAAKARS